jgi:hypothetical protein
MIVINAAAAPIVNPPRGKFLDSGLEAIGRALCDLRRISRGRDGVVSQLNGRCGHKMRSNVVGLSCPECAPNVGREVISFVFMTNSDIVRIASGCLASR